MSDEREAPATVPDDISVEPNPHEVKRIKAEIDITDRAALLGYGDQAQREVSAYADSILRDTMNKDSGDVGALLSDLLIKVQGLDPTTLQKAGFFDRLFGGLKRRVARFQHRFENVAEQVDAVSLELERSRDRLKRDIAMLDGLYDKNLDHLRLLEAYIVAGAEYLDEARGSAVPKLEKEAEEAAEGAPSQMAAQRLRDATQALDRLEKRVHDLKLSRMIAIQAMPQIRLIQSGNSTLADKLQTSMHTTIPTWKNQMTVALALYRQHNALALQKEVSETTNELLRKNAEQLRQGTVDIEREAQRGIVDVETLAAVNQDLIGTIAEVLAIQKEGREKRQAAEAEMKRIEGELKRTLISASRGEAPAGQSSAAETR